MAGTREIVGWHGLLRGLAPVPARVALGWIFIAHGAGKLFGWWGGMGMARTIEEFSKIGLPWPEASARLAASWEFFGGVAVLLGLLTRLSALGLAVTMAVAIATVHGPRGFFLSAGGYEYNVALLGLSLALAIGGPGRFAVDGWIRARLARKG
jgi:putative oxidoreductase